MNHLYILAITLSLFNVAKTVYCNDSKIIEFELTYSKKSSTAYVAVYKLIT